MKKLVLSLGALSCAYLGSVAYIGGIAQDYYIQEFEVYKQIMQDSGQMSLSDLTYERGFFGASVSFTGDLQLDAEQVLEFSVLGDVQHGPIAWTRNGLKLGLYNADSYSSLTNVRALMGEHSDPVESGQVEALVSYFEAGFLESSMTGKFFGGYDFSFDLMPFEVSMDGAAIDFKGLNISGSGAYGVKAWKGRSELAGLKVESSNGNLLVGASLGEFDVVWHRANIVTGLSRIDFPSLSYEGPSGTAEVTNASLVAEQGLKDGQVNYVQTLDLGQVDGSLPVSGGEYRLELNNLSVEGVDRWTAWLAKVNSVAVEDIDQSSLEELEEVVESVFQAGLEVKQHIKVDAYDGVIESTFDAQYLEFEDARKILQVNDPIDYLDALKLTLNINMDMSVAGKLPIALLLPGLEQQGFIVVKDDQLRLDAVIERGETVINDKPYPLKDQLKMMYPAPKSESASKADVSERSEADSVSS